MRSRLVLYGSHVLLHVRMWVLLHLEIRLLLHMGIRVLHRRIRMLHLRIRWISGMHRHRWLLAHKFLLHLLLVCLLM